jgi:hypothetical protein
MIKFKITRTKDSTKLLNSYTFKRVAWGLTLISLMFIIMGLVAIFTRTEPAGLYAGLFLVAFGVLCSPIVWGLLRLLQNVVNKSDRFIKVGSTETYEFDEDTVTITQICGDDYQSKVVAKYSSLYRVRETASHYYLSIFKREVYIIPKTSLVEGRIADLNDIFSRKLTKKVIKR